MEYGITIEEVPTCAVIEADTLVFAVIEADIITCAVFEIDMVSTVKIDDVIDIPATDELILEFSGYQGEDVASQSLTIGGVGEVESSMVVGEYPLGGGLMLPYTVEVQHTAETSALFDDITVVGNLVTFDPKTLITIGETVINVNVYYTNLQNRTTHDVVEITFTVLNPFTYETI